jgi:hypothetical protein
MLLGQLNVGSMQGDKITAYRVLMGKPEIKRPFGRPSLEGSIILNRS